MVLTKMLGFEYGKITVTTTYVIAYRLTTPKYTFTGQYPHELSMPLDDPGDNCRVTDSLHSHIVIHSTKPFAVSAALPRTVLCHAHGSVDANCRRTLTSSEETFKPC